jgi:uncharacterized protein YbaP (TraB family)
MAPFNRFLTRMACLLFLALPAQADQQALFWTIERDGASAGYLLGTIHSEDPRVLDFSAPFLELLSSSRVFAMELVPDLSTLAELAVRMQLPEGQTLEALAGPRRFADVARVLETYGVSREQARTLQPWAAMMTLSVPPPKTGLFMDFSLSLRASGAGITVIGLESLDQQLAFLEAMRLEDQLALLDHAVLESHHVSEMHQQMVDIYLEDDLDRLHRQAMEQLQTVPESARRMFIEQGIEVRNRNMLTAALPHLQEGGLFIAVGALHLTGETGLIRLLRDQGFAVRPALWPFSESQ